MSLGNWLAAPAEDHEDDQLKPGRGVLFQKPIRHEGVEYEVGWISHYDHEHCRYVIILQWPFSPSGPEAFCNDDGTISLRTPEARPKLGFAIAAERIERELVLKKSPTNAELFIGLLADSTRAKQRAARCTCSWHTFSEGINAGIPQRQLDVNCPVHRDPDRGDH